MRIGLGYDLHRLEPGRRLVLGGVEVAHTHGLAGHSDADVLTHAICDALLGAAALGDLGTFFPDTDAEWKDADSLTLLATCAAHLAGAGFRIQNVDATLIAEQPKLSSHREAMRAAIAQAMNVARETVSIKYTTNEGCGAIGRGEAMAAHAVALISKA